MKQIILTLTALLMLSACAGGGGSSAGGAGNQPSGSLSWAKSTVTASASYMKQGDSITVTVQVRDTNNAPMDLDRDFQVQPLCSGCLTAMNSLSVTDFALVSKGTYTYTFTAQDTSDVSFMLIYYGGSQGAPADTIANQPKLSLVKWELCVEPLTSGQVFRQVTVSGTTYNAICDRADLAKLNYSNVASSPALLTQNFRLMKDIVMNTNEEVRVGTSPSASFSSSFTGILDGNSKSVTGGNLVVVKASGATLRNISVTNKNQYFGTNLTNTVINTVAVTITNAPGNIGFGTCTSVTISNSGALTCANNF